MSNLIPIPKISSKALQEMFDYRLARLRQSMGEQNVSLSILTNPVSLRYAIDFDEYQVFQSNTPTCYLFVPLEGPLVMHGATQKDFPNVSEYRRPNFISPFDGGVELVNKFMFAVNKHFHRQAKLFCVCICITVCSAFQNMYEK